MRRRATIWSAWGTPLTRPEALAIAVALRDWGSVAGGTLNGARCSWRRRANVMQGRDRSAIEDAGVTGRTDIRIAPEFLAAVHDARRPSWYAYDHDASADARLHQL